MAIAVVFSSGGIDKLEIYKRVGVPEVWFWQDGALQVYFLNETYENVTQSQLLPHLDLELLARFVNYFDQYDAIIEFAKMIQ